MKKVLLFSILFFVVAAAVMTVMASSAFADIFKQEDLIVLDKEKAGGGTGVLYGKYAFTRDMPPMENPVREIGWLTLKSGDSIGFHKHDVNEDVYIVVSGTGVFTNDDGKEHEVKAGDITIARKGQSHGLVNTGKEDLVIISVIAGKTPQ
ncbi:MAG: cupin domain-containing protein [Synergistaceae bacterium]|jgi:mannose-6-phosphate isomerase-like protein (cupin superfamily)|nr:cupin domain-containing protein [Synergistaceae bacterium]